MAEYTSKQLLDELKKTGQRLSISTLIRWEESGVFPKPLRRTRNKARIWTDEHLAKIKEHRDKVEAPPEKRTRHGASGRKKS